MSGTAKIWSSIRELAAVFGQNPSAAESILNSLEADLLKHGKPARDAIRREMICIVASLSRLESRLMTAEGPLGKTTQ
jgi:hypothetical protein